MKTCIVVLGNDQEAAESTAKTLANILVKKNLPEGKISILYFDLKSMDAVLKRGARMPHEYEEAERWLLMGIDKECIAYTEKISEELAKVAKNQPGEPEILSMSKVVLAECRRRGICSVYVHDTSRTATDPDLLYKLRDAGLQTCSCPPSLPADELDTIMLTITTSRSNEQTTRLMNQIRKRMSYLASRMGFQVALFDRAAWPLWDAEKLSAKWGPELLDGYGLYLNAAADWAAQVSKLVSPPPHSLT